MWTLRGELTRHRDSPGSDLAFKFNFMFCDGITGALFVLGVFRLLILI